MGRKRPTQRAVLFYLEGQVERMYTLISQLEHLEDVRGRDVSNQQVNNIQATQRTRTGEEDFILEGQQQ